jgi:hypothetical protein
MKQVVVVFHLREGSESDAARLAAAEPPFDPGEAGFTRLAAYVTQREVIFVLEGEEPLWSQDEPVTDFLQPALRERLVNGASWPTCTRGPPSHCSSGKRLPTSSR